MPKRGSASEERLSDTLVELGGRVRIERGPKVKEAKATEKLLSNDVTADHYQVGRVDAVGKTIALDKPMRYVDWFGEYEWKVYALRTEPLLDALGNQLTDDAGNVRTQDRWVQVGAVDGDEEEALERARAVLDAEE
jgi:hypothetical protein